MSIEKSFSSDVRKAIEGTSEKIASKESLSKPEQKHYNEAFNFYRFIKAFKPELYREAISISSRGKELKEKMGEELFGVFNKVWKEITNEGENNLTQTLKQIYSTDKMQSNDILNACEDFLRGKVEKLKKDPRIVSAFSGKEELLDGCAMLLVRSSISIIYFIVKPDGIDSPDIPKKILADLFERMTDYYQSIV